ncbi:MAG UNVERIFIED_CONTAM: hypothetical protein LVR18_38695 [Planctomycetaceae bacterium]
MSPRPAPSNDCCESSGSIGSDEGSSRRSRCRTPKLRGLSPRPALSNDYCESSGPIGSDEGSIAAHPAAPRSRGDCPRDWRRVTIIANLRGLSVLTKDPSPLTRPSPEAAGIVPATGAPSNDYCESSGPIGSDEGSIAAHPAHPRSRGDCPRDSAPSNDYCESSGPIGSDEGSIAAHRAHPEAAGIVPATGATKNAFVANLRGLSVLTKDPSPLTRPSPKLRGLSPRPAPSNDLRRIFGA